LCEAAARDHQVQSRALAGAFPPARMTPLRSVSLGSLFGDGDEVSGGAPRDKALGRHSTPPRSVSLGSLSQSAAAERAHRKVRAGGRMDIDTAYELMGYGHDEVSSHSALQRVFGEARSQKKAPQTRSSLPPCSAVRSPTQPCAAMCSPVMPMRMPEFEFLNLCLRLVCAVLQRVSCADAA